MSAPTIDLAQLTKTTDCVVDGQVLWVRPGHTEAGRYWQFLTRTDVPLGMVVERDGVLLAVFNADSSDAACLFLAGLCAVGGAS